MRNAIFSNITPQDKNVYVNNKFGNTGIKNQQGTSVVKYDTLPIDGRTTFNFFEGSSARNFPFSNCGSDGNKLGVGNTLVVERIYFSLLQQEDDKFINVDTIRIVDGTFDLGELNFNIANSTVLRNFPLLSTLAPFNKNAEFAFEQVYELDTNIVIPPLLEYIGQVRVPEYDSIPYASYFIRMTIEGSGSIIAPRTTF